MQAISLIQQFKKRNMQAISLIQLHLVGISTY